MPQTSVELNDLGLTITDRMDAADRHIQELTTQLQYLQGAGGLLEPLSNVAGYKQNTADTADPTLTGGVTYIGQAHLLLAGENIIFAQPTNSPYLRISADLSGVACVNYVVATDGSGTHTTLASAVAAAITAQVDSTIFICDDLTANDIEIGGMESGQSITILSWQDKWVTISATTGDMFKQTSGGGWGDNSGLFFKNIGLKVNTTGKAMFLLDTGNEIGNVWFDHVFFNESNGYLVRNDSVLDPLGNVIITVTNCSGAFYGFFQNEGSTPPDQLIALNNHLTLNRWWHELVAGAAGTATNAANFTLIQGGQYTVTNVITISAHGNFKRWTIRDIQLKSECAGAHFRHSVTDTNHNGVEYSNIIFIAKANTTDFGDFQGPVANPQSNLYIHGIHGVIASGVVPTGTFLTVSSNIVDPYVADIWAPDWPTLYTGPDIEGGVTLTHDHTGGPEGGQVDHGTLLGLSDDDHTQYALLAGRAAGQVLNGGIAASENLTLTSTAHATKGQVRFEGDANFHVSLPSNSPRITFDEFVSLRYIRGVAPAGVLEIWTDRTGLASELLASFTSDTSRGLVLEGTATVGSRLTTMGPVGTFMFQGFVVDGGGLEANPRLAFTTTAAGGRISFGVGGATAPDITLDRNTVVDPITGTSQPVLQAERLLATSRLFFVNKDVFIDSGENSMRLAHWRHVTVLLDRDNNETVSLFRVMTNASTIAAATNLLQVTEAGNVNALGFLRVGSMTAPTNVTAGDLTVTRLFVGNAVAIAGIEALITGDMQATTSIRIGRDGVEAGTLIVHSDVAAAARGLFRFVNPNMVEAKAEGDNIGFRLLTNNSVTAGAVPGAVELQAGDGLNSLGGHINITAGDGVAGAAPDHSGGFVNILAGNAVGAGTGGIINLESGRSPGSGSHGAVSVRLRSDGIADIGPGGEFRVQQDQDGAGGDWQSILTVINTGMMSGLGGHSLGNQLDLKNESDDAAEFGGIGGQYTDWTLTAYDNATHDSRNLTYLISPRDKAFYLWNAHVHGTGEEFLKVFWTGNVLKIVTDASGTGAYRELTLDAGNFSGAASLNLFGHNVILRARDATNGIFLDLPDAVGASFVKVRDSAFAEVAEVDSDGNAEFLGYLRVGSIAAPTNVTVGDLTAVRGLFGTDVALGTSVGLELNSTTKAFLPSRMTTTQRDAMTAVDGMVIYNTTDGVIQGREAGAWVDL